ncbi:MAG: ABC transporter ATP-binding protein [Neomegalonema sp.]|nr:ABC transporter ATP-binding protein [Neomegalonema sp.]
MSALLNVENLRIGFRGAETCTVEGAFFSVHSGETIAIVGESGSGKTLSCRAVMGLLPPKAEIRGGSAAFCWEPGAAAPVDLLQMSERKLQRLRGDKISMIFQEPMSALSPLHTIGAQTAEVALLHGVSRRAEAKRMALEAFERVGFPDPSRAWSAYPFELSGGLRQRAMIAMAIIGQPKLLIADEPTTALDVTTQALVLNLIKQLQADTGMGVLLITHDLGVVANVADAVVVMRKGRVVEAGDAGEVVGDPAHGYTQKLVAAAPKMAPKPAPITSLSTPDPILSLRGVTRIFEERRSGLFKPARRFPALRGIDLDVPRGETVAVVGESGSGKTTLARIALAADRPTAGTVRFRPDAQREDLDVHALSRKELCAFRRSAQIVMQDPFAALSPRMRVREILTEPLEIHRLYDQAERRARAADLMRRVGLDPMMIDRFPHAFSGGQRQRISIARALMLEPQFLVCDEPTSALDVSVQSQILELLEQIRRERGLSYLFISHDLAVVGQLADWVAVMRSGLIVELARPSALFAAPRHPYTRALIAASPEPDVSRKIDVKAVAAGAGEPSSWPEPYRFDGERAPELIEAGVGHFVRAAA